MARRTNNGNGNSNSAHNGSNAARPVQSSESPNKDSTPSRARGGNSSSQIQSQPNPYSGTRTDKGAYSETARSLNQGTRGSDANTRRDDARDNAELAKARRDIRAPRKFGADTTDVTRDNRQENLPREKLDAKKDKRPHCNKRPERTKGGGRRKQGFSPLVLGKEMKDLLLSTAMRAVPAIAGSLVTYGVSLEHSEPIAIGVVLGLVTVVDLVIKAVQPKLPMWKP